MDHLTESDIRKFVFAAYKEKLGKGYDGVKGYVATRKPPPHGLNGKELAAFRKVMWELALEGVISPGTGADQLLHGARLTEYGCQCITQGRILPHDIEGYLGNLTTAMGDELDELILQYASDALECFHRNNLRAAVVMLGVASERSMEILKNAYVQALVEEKRSKALSKLNDRNLRQRFDNLWKRIQQVKTPDKLHDKLEGDLRGAFQLIRRSRNEAGHFTTIETDKLTALACLASFPGFVRTTFALAAHLRSGK
jgi:hypothetical protein